MVVLDAEARWARLEDEVLKCRDDPVRFARVFFGLHLEPRQAEALTLGGRISTTVAGRRFGKSTIRLIEAVHAVATRRRRRPPEWYIAAPSLDQAKLYITELERYAGENPLLERLLARKDPIKWSPFPEARFRNGGRLFVRSTARDGVYLRGKGADGVVMTEAAFVKDRVYHDVVRAMVLDRKGFIRLETTPNGMNYVYKLFEEGRRDESGYYRSFHATCFDNGRVDREELERIRRETPELTWRIEYLAEFVEDDTWVFPWAVLAEVFDDYPVAGKPEPGHAYVLGVDLAKYQDYTVILVLDVTQRPWTVAEYHRYQGQLYHAVAAQVNELRRKYRAGRVFLDATGVGDPVAELIESVEPIVFTPKLRNELISNLSVLLQQKAVLLPASWTALRDELRYFRRVKHGQSVKPEATQGYHDDCVMALALACWANQAGGAPASPEAVEALRGLSVYGG